jgi:putative glycosyltransferase
MTGIAHAGGDLVFLLDSDLDEDPELLTVFHSRLLEDDCDVVYGFQPRRRGGIVTKLTGEVYFWLLDKLSADQIPRNIMTARLMKRDYVNALLEHRDREFLISQLWASSGFRQVGVAATKHVSSTSTYSFRMRVEYFVKHLTTSSTKLLYMIFYLGLALTVAAAALIVYFILLYAFERVPVNGFTSIIVSIWFFGALSTVILGIQGIYVANILSESKRRPYTVVRKVYGGALPDRVEIHEGR